jgi:crossover junction endodeoxyribonuclease RusA
VQHICAAQKEPRLAANELVRVEIIAAMPDRRRRDLDNIQKAILDALTHAGVWEDDSQVDDIRVFRARAENGELIIKGLITVVIIPILKPNVEQCHSHGKM